MSAKRAGCHKPYKGRLNGFFKTVGGAFGLTWAALINSFQLVAFHDESGKLSGRIFNYTCVLFNILRGIFYKDTLGLPTTPI